MVGVYGGADNKSEDRQMKMSASEYSGYHY